MDRLLVEAHRGKAQRHEASADALANDRLAEDWPVVMRFYAALHWVDAYLVSKSVPVAPGKHHERWQAIRSTPELSAGRGRAVRLAYQRLQSLSEQVRYDPHFDARPQDRAGSQADLRTVRGYLEPKTRDRLDEWRP